MTTSSSPEQSLSIVHIQDLIKRGQFDEAMTQCKHLEASYPRDGELHYLLAQIARHKNNFGAALKHINSALQNDPDNIDYLSEKGHALYSLGEVSEAAQAYEHILEKAPNHINALNNLAVIYTEQKRHTEAEKMLHHSLTLNPHQTSGWLNLCAVVEDFEFREKDVVSYAEQAVSCSPGEVKPYLYLCKALLRQGYPERALQTAYFAASISPRDPNIHYRIGLCHLQLEDYQAAAQAFELVLAIDDRHADTYHALSELFFSLGDTLAAEEASLKAFQIEPENEDHKELLAKIRFAGGHYTDAEEIYNRKKERQNIYTIKKIKSVEQWAKENNLKTLITLPEQEWQVPPTLFFNKPTAHEVNVEKTPKAYLSEIPDAFIYPPREIILVDNKKTALYNYFASSPKGYSLTTDKNLPFAADEAIAIDQLPESNKTIPSGIYMLSDFPYNYAHWLTEVITRFHAIDLANIPAGTPLLVNDKIYPQQIESLKNLATNRYPICTLSNHQVYRVKQLYFPSSPLIYLQNKLRPGEKHLPNEAIFHPTAIQYLREKLVTTAQKSNTKNRRLWISRKNQKKYRRFINEVAIEEIFKGLGFEIVHPEHMSFHEQIKIFSEAEMIAGGSGAGMANIVFSPANAKILIFTIDHPHFPYCYFNNLAKINNQNILYATGQMLKNIQLYGYEYQSDFIINENLALSAAQEFFQL